VGILSGALSVRHYRVQGELGPDHRDRLIDALNSNAFRDPLSPLHKEEILGWAQIHNLLDTDFSDINLWLYNQYAIFSFRMDKKTVPARLFKAHLQKKMAAWCKETGREKCPPKVKEELKELLEQDMLRQTLPKVAVHEVAWNLSEGWVAFHNQSDLINDKFRKHFHHTFNLVLVPVTPLDFLEDRPDQLPILMGGTGTELQEAG